MLQTATAETDGQKDKLHRFNTGAYWLWAHSTDTVPSTIIGTPSEYEQNRL